MTPPKMVPCGLVSRGIMTIWMAVYGSDMVAPERPGWSAVLYVSRGKSPAWVVVKPATGDWFAYSARSLAGLIRVAQTFNYQAVKPRPGGFAEGSAWTPHGMACPRTNGEPGCVSAGSRGPSATRLSYQELPALTQPGSPLGCVRASPGRSSFALTAIARATSSFAGPRYSNR